VSRVFYPGLPSHPQHALAMRQQSGVGGAVLSFDVKRRTPRRRAHGPSMCSTHCRCCRCAPTWATPRPCWPTRPAPRTALTEAQRQAAGIGQGLIRLAVGLEHLDDMKADLLRGLDTLNMIQ
jgi:O-succinylhomoserine sulfhydrylase